MLAVAGVKLLQRKLAVVQFAIFVAHQHHVGAQRNQQRHGVANGRAIGHIAAQRACVAHRQAGKAVGKVAQLRPVLDQGRIGIVQRDGGAYGNVLRVLFNTAQFAGLGDVNHVVKLLVLFGDPQAHIGAARHQLRARVRGACFQERRQSLR